MTLALRTYAPEDFETLYTIDQACYEPAIAYSRRELRNYLRFSGTECVVAENDGRICGFCIAAYSAARGYIVTIDVLEEFRKHGVGSALIVEIERRLVLHGVQEIGLDTATDNAPAVAFWTKHGYRTRGLSKGYYPGGRDAYSMLKGVKRLPKIPGRESRATTESENS
jgi:ribosomal-protein-alanine N-acetyltransferase